MNDFPITFRFREFTLYARTFPIYSFFLEYSKNPRARIYLEYLENGKMPLRKGLLQPTISKEHQVPQILKASPLNRNKREKLWKQ